MGVQYLGQHDQVLCVKEVVVLESWMEQDLEVQEAVATRIVLVMVVWMDWAQDSQIHLSGAFLVCVWCIHLCYKSVMDSGDM